MHWLKIHKSLISSQMLKILHFHENFSCRNHPELDFIFKLSETLGGEDSIAGLREVKFSAFINSETPGWYIQVVTGETGAPAIQGKGASKQSKLSSLTQLRHPLQALLGGKTPGKVCIWMRLVAKEEAKETTLD